MNTILGRLIFSLYSDENLEKYLIYEIFKNEYEIYPIHNKDILLKLLYEFPSSIVFINMDYNKNFDWQKYSLEIKSDDKLNEVSLNFISNSKNKINKEFIDNTFILNKDINSVKDKILKYLENNYAKGRRKFVRADLNHEDRINFTINVNNNKESGYITNISSAAGVFDFDNKSLHFDHDKLLDNMELRIKEKALKLSGKVLREIDAFDENPYVILFNRESMNQEDIEVIRNYIYDILQKRMYKRCDNLLKEL